MEQIIKEKEKLAGHTVDQENFAVKIISRSRPNAKIKHAKNKLRGDDQ